MGVGSCRGGIHFGGMGSHRVLLVSVKVWWVGGKPGGGHVFGEWEAIEGSHWLDGWLGEWEATGVLCIGGGGHRGMAAEGGKLWGSVMHWW